MRLSPTCALRRSHLRFLAIALFATVCLALPVASASAGVAYDVEITAGPAEGSTVADQSITFEMSYVGSDSLMSYLCSIDGAPESGCGSPFTYDALADGPHTFSVSAVVMGMTMNCFPGPPPDYIPMCIPMPNQYTTSATTRSFTIDRSVVLPIDEPVLDKTPPTASIDSGPAEGERLNSGSVTFGISGEAGATLTCSLDTAPPAACGPAFKTGVLDSGPHKFELTATDAAGNKTDVARNFRVLNCKKVRKRNKRGKVMRTRGGKIRYKTVC